MLTTVPIERRHLLWYGVAALFAAVLTATGNGVLTMLGLPFLVACVAALLGSPIVFLLVIAATSGIGFTWLEGAGIEVAGHTINVSGLHWGSIAVIASTCLVLTRGARMPKPWLTYAALLALATAGILWSVDRFEAIKITIQLATPLLVGLLALRILRRESDIGLVLTALWTGLALSLLAAVFVEIGGAFDGGSPALTGPLGDRTFAMYLVPLFALALAGFRYRNPAYALLAAGLLFVAAMTLSRMVTATMMLLMVVSSIRAPVHARVIAGTLLFAAGLTVLQIPAFRDRVLVNQRRGLTSTVEISGEGERAQLVVGGIALSGRGLLWLQTARHGAERPVLGWGTGSAKTFLTEDVGVHIEHPHSEYLRFFHDLGTVGLVTVLTMGAVMLESLRRLHAKARTTRAKEATLAALLAWTAYMTLSITDNAMVYTTFFTINVFLLLAIAWRVTVLSERAVGATPARAADLEPVPGG